MRIPFFMKVIIAIKILIVIGFAGILFYTVPVLYNYGMDGFGKSIGTFVRSFNEASEVQQ